MLMEPYHISPNFFNQRMREVSLGESVSVFEDLKGVGILKDDNCSHFIQYNDWCACQPAAVMGTGISHVHETTRQCLAIKGGF